MSTSMWTLFAIERNFSAAAVNDILDRSVLIHTLWQQFGNRHFLFKLDNMVVHKNRGT